LALSDKTLTAINDERYVTDETDDFYPCATTLGRTSPYTSNIRRLNPDEIPTTTADMSRAFKWQYGDKLYGTQAKKNAALKRHRKDINKSYGKEDDYKDIYIDTLLPYPIGPRFEDGDL
jgi:hypothetical protein